MTLDNLPGVGTDLQKQNLDLDARSRAPSMGLNLKHACSSTIEEKKQQEAFWKEKSKEKYSRRKKATTDM